MNIIIWLIVGAFVGWIASLVMNTDAQQGIFLNIVVGVIGALIGGFLLGGPTINQVISIYSVIISFVGAIILLAVVNLVQRGRLR